MKSFAPAEFVKALRTGFPSDPVVIEGIVKESDGEDSLQFSFASDCNKWVKIPVELLDGQVEYRGTAPCRDHEHPRVRLTLKEPEGSNPASRAFFELLRQLVAAGDGSGRTRSGGLAQVRAARRGCHHVPTGEWWSRVVVHCYATNRVESGDAASDDRDRSFRDAVSNALEKAGCPGEQIHMPDTYHVVWAATRMGYELECD